jgi:hypothetical protein
VDIAIARTDEYEHHRRTLFTVMSLNLAVLDRQLTRSESVDSVLALQTLQRLQKAHDAMLVFYCIYSDPELPA